jgi:oligopeptide/dipeptide ABC transporter ATP-binding protein
MAAEHLLEIDAVSCEFSSAAGRVLAVDDVSFTIAPGETFGLVGESGSGKSTLARLATGLLAPSAGSVRLDGQDVRQKGAAARSARARLVQMVFQDPFGSLNPRLRVERIIGEPLAVNGVGDESSRRERVTELLGKVGLSVESGRRYPHELSGGQRQRIAIARALALNPRLIVCDEAVSALDVSIQAQVLNLFRDLQAEFGLAYLFISHDLRVVHHVADRIAVMYRGRIVEMGRAEQVLGAPHHPYTRALIAAIPPEPGETPPAVTEMVASVAPADATVEVAGGCRYRSRCPLATPQCASAEPPLAVREGGHQVACWVS